MTYFLHALKENVSNRKETLKFSYLIPRAYCINKIRNKIINNLNQPILISTVNQKEFFTFAFLNTLNCSKFEKVNRTNDSINILDHLNDNSLLNSVDKRNSSFESKNLDISERINEINSNEEGIISLKQQKQSYHYLMQLKEVVYKICLLNHNSITSQFIQNIQTLNDNKKIELNQNKLIKKLSFRDIYQLVRLEFKHSISSSQIHKFILMYLEDNYWDEFNSEKKILFDKEIMCSSNIEINLNLIKNWSYQNHVPFYKVYKYYHYRMSKSKTQSSLQNSQNLFGENLSRSTIDSKKTNKLKKITDPEILLFKNLIKNLIVNTNFKHLSGNKYIISKEIDKFLIDELKWTRKQIIRRLLHYYGHQDRLRYIKKKQLIQMIKSREITKFDNSNLNSCQQQLELSKEQLGSFLRRLKNPPKKISLSDRIFIIETYEKYKFEFNQYNEENSEHQNFISLQSPLLKELSHNLKLPKYLIRNIIENYENNKNLPLEFIEQSKSCQNREGLFKKLKHTDFTSPKQKEIIDSFFHKIIYSDKSQDNSSNQNLNSIDSINFLMGSNDTLIKKKQSKTESKSLIDNLNSFIQLSSDQIESLMKEANLTRRQVYYQIERLKYPLGEWTPTKKQFIDKILEEENYAPFFEISYLFEDFIKESNLSRKQVRDYIHYQRKKRNLT